MNADLKPVHKRRECYSHAIQDAAKRQRREEGQKRQEAYDKLTPQQKIALLDAGGPDAPHGYVAKKQRAKLKALIEEQNAKSNA